MALIKEHHRKKEQTPDLWQGNALEFIPSTHTVQRQMEAGERGEKSELVYLFHKASQLLTDLQSLGGGLTRQTAVPWESFNLENIPPNFLQAGA